MRLNEKIDSPEDPYLFLIQAFVEQGYKISKFKDIEWSTRPNLFIRHDVDIDIYSALELARRESGGGIVSTYFFMLRCPFYNPLCSECQEIIYEIYKLGHDIALHINLSLYGGYESTQDGILKEMETFSRFFPFVNEDVYSVHRPNKLNNADTDTQKESHYNVCSKLLYGHHVDYISDSAGRWSYGDPLNKTTFKDRVHIQLLTHPIWWTIKSDSPAKKLDLSLKRNYERSIELAKIHLPKVYHGDITFKHSVQE